MDLFSIKVKSQIRNESTDVVDQFNLSSVNSGAKNKLNVVKLVESLDNVKNIGELKKQLVSKSKDKKSSTLDVPLHRQARDKIERSVAYDQSKRKVGFWDEIVRRNRLSDKLTFPLRKFESDDSKVPNESSLEGAVARFQLTEQTANQFEKNELRSRKKKCGQRATVDAKPCDGQRMLFMPIMNQLPPPMLPPIFLYNLPMENLGRLSQFFTYNKRKTQPRTELEIETEKFLKSSKNYLPPDQEYTEAEKEALSALSIEEAEKRKNELSKMRALISYKTAQNKRQNSIKSKRYHRLMKKQKRKDTEKEVLELLRRNDREGAKEKLELLEMDRIAERSTLRHKSTGKWAKQIRNLAKKDPELRQALQDQLKLSRELAEKVFAAKNDDKENSDAENIDNNDDHKTVSIKKSSVKIDLTPKIADIVTKNVNDDHSQDDQNLLISEAFADDDVLEEELKNEMNEDSEDDLDDVNANGKMPGWNDWVGPKTIEKQRKKADIKLAKKEAMKKERKAQKVRLNEKADESIEKFQVKRVPFPYGNVELFEEELTQPLGKEWNSAISYKTLLEPPIKTKAGHIIEPISRDNIAIKMKRDEGDELSIQKEEKKHKKKKISRKEDGYIKV